MRALPKVKTKIVYLGQEISYTEAALYLRISPQSLRTRVMRLRKKPDGSNLQQVKLDDLARGSMKYRPGRLRSPLAELYRQHAESDAQAEGQSKQIAAQPVMQPTVALLPKPQPVVKDTLMRDNDGNVLDGGDVYKAAILKGLTLEQAMAVATLYVKKNFQPGSLEHVMWFDAP